MKEKKDTISDSGSPLIVERKGDKLVISIGVDRLDGHDEHYEIPELEIINKDDWVKDIINELTKEDEAGASPLTKLFDNAIIDAIGDGSVGLSETSPTHFGVCSKCEDDLVPVFYTYKWGDICRRCFALIKGQ